MKFCQPIPRPEDRIFFRIIGFDRLVKKTQFGSVLDAAAMADQADQVPSPSTSSSRREPRVFDQPCAICGGLATGYHYEVPSCNGCKTFFRRTVLSRKTYRCIGGDGKCLVLRATTNNNIEQAVTRRKIRCRQCRYEKCIERGMSPDAVTTLSNLLEPETLELRRLLKLEQDSKQSGSGNRTDGTTSPADVDVVSRLSGPVIEYYQGSHIRLGSAQEASMKKDLLKAHRFATDFEDFISLPLDTQDEMVRETLFPLTVAKDALDAVDNEYEAQVCFGSSLAKLVGPFLRENVEHTEFVLMKTLLVINGICQAGCARAEEAKSRHTKLLFQYLSGRNGSQAPARFGTLMQVFQNFIATAASRANHTSPTPSRSGSQSVQGSLSHDSQDQPLT